MSIANFFNFNSSAIRFILSFFYKPDKQYKILFGVNRGKKLLYRKEVNYHTMLGLWEADSFEFLLKTVYSKGYHKQKATLVDIGANLGYYSLFFDTYAHKDSKIYLFEPSDSILPILKKNLEINKLSNFNLSECACSDSDGEIDFYIGEHHHQSSIKGDWSGNEQRGKKVTVKCCQLDTFFKDNSPDELPDIVKIDVEGAAKEVFKGMQWILKTKQPIILIESHTAAEDAAISQMIIENTYEAFRINTNSWVKNKDKDYKDKEGVWGTMLLVPGDQKFKLNF